MYLKVFTLSLILFFISVTNLFSETIVTIPKKTLTRGVLDTITINFATKQKDITSLKLTLRFNAYVLDIKKVLGSPDFIVNDPSPKFNLNLENLENAILTIESNNLTFDDSPMILCQLLVEGLVYKDSVDTMRIVALEINGFPIDFTFNDGVIIVQGPSVIPIKSTYISIPSPLPTRNYLWFYFGLSRASYLEFSIFNSLGEKVYSSVHSPDLFKVWGKNLQFPVDGKFEVGDYKLDIYLPQDFPSGVYFLQLNAFSIGIFSSSFLVVK